MEDTWYNRSFYRGYTPKQLDAMIERDQVRQQIMLNAEPITITPPALFTDEMLEQIRAVVRKEVREEVRAALNEDESERMMEEDASLVSGTIVKDGKLTDFGRSLTAELEHMGKLYKGVLYFVKDVE